MIIEATRRRALGCTDLLLLTTTASLHLEPVRTLALSTRHTVRWGGLSPLELADVRASGVRLFRMPKGMAGTLVSAYETALLFVQPALFRRVSSAAAERNIRFLRDHAPGSLGVGAFEKRSTTDVIPDEADVEDGDMLCILRLDGLDPLMNWGTGGGCGHNIMALRFGGVLHIVESQQKSGYWPKVSKQVSNTT